MPARGSNAAFDRAADAVLAGARAVGPEDRARRLVERLALVLQGALLLRHAPAAVSDAFCGTRLGGDGGITYGAWTTAGAATGAILDRQRRF